MAYEKNTWKTGDIVSSQKLNHMEDGIANSENVFIVRGATINDDGLTGTLDKTWQQIRDAMGSKICVIVIEDGDNARCDFIGTTWDNPSPKPGYSRYQVLTVSTGVTFSTVSKDGYPAIYIDPAG
jgi:hypothetical protein